MCLRLLACGFIGGRGKNSPPQGIVPHKLVATVTALLITFPHVDALVVTLKIRFARKAHVAVVDGARERIIALLVVRLHVKLEVIPPAEKFVASLNLALEVGLLLGR